MFGWTPQGNVIRDAGSARDGGIGIRTGESLTRLSNLETLEPRAAYALWAESYPPHAHNPLMLAEERAMLSLLPGDLAGLKVLDAGCGSGRYLRHALARGAGSAVGVDLSEEMLRASLTTGMAGLIQGDLSALPIVDGWADVTICGLALGHLEDLMKPLAELRRVTRRGGLIVCSDFHPAGASLGWTRDFKADGRRYAVRHTVHLMDMWQAACHSADLSIEAVLEPHLDPMDIPEGAHFDCRALEIPVAVVYALR